MRDLVLAARVDHVVISYSEEGILSRDEIGEILAEFSGAKRFDFGRGFREVLHQRFRSDTDHAADDSRKIRQYRVLEGKSRNEIGEWLFHARRDPKRTSPVLS